MSLTQTYWNPPMIKAGESSTFTVEGIPTTGHIVGEGAPTGDVEVPNTFTHKFTTAGRFTWHYNTEKGNKELSADGGQSAFATVIVS